MCVCVLCVCVKVGWVGEWRQLNLDGHLAFLPSLFCPLPLCLSLSYLLTLSLSSSQFVDFRRRIVWSHTRAAVDTEFLFLSSLSPSLSSNTLSLPNPAPVKSLKDISEIFLMTIEKILVYFESSFSASSSSPPSLSPSPSPSPSPSSSPSPPSIPSLCSLSTSHPFFSFSEYDSLVVNEDDDVCEWYTDISHPPVTRGWVDQFVLSDREKSDIWKCCGGFPTSVAKCHAGRNSWMRIRRICIGILMEITRPPPPQVQKFLSFESFEL